MADHKFKDWMEGPPGGKELTAREKDIIADYVSCTKSTDKLHGDILVNRFIAFNLGVYKLPSLLIDMGDYLNQDSDLITVARGKILSCWPGILLLNC
jgi:DNA repair/transcription protein MET18/MMS19